MLDQALVDAGDDDRLIFEIELVYAANGRRTLATTRPSSRTRRVAVASAERLGEPGPLASALAQLGAGLFYRGEGLPRDLFERAIELERGADESSPTYYLAEPSLRRSLRIENDVDAARPLLESAVERARRRGEESGDLIPLLVRLARLESDAGNPPAADDGSPRRPRQPASR